MIYSPIELDHDYHVVELARSLPQELRTWLEETQGKPSSRTWFLMQNRLYFHSQRQHLLFLLKASDL